MMPLMVHTTQSGFPEMTDEEYLEKENSLITQLVNNEITYSDYVGRSKDLLNKWRAAQKANPVV